MKDVGQSTQSPRRVRCGLLAIGLAITLRVSTMRIHLLEWALLGWVWTYESFAIRFVRDLRYCVVQSFLSTVLQIT